MTFDLLDQYLNLIKYLLFRIHIKKLSYELWFYDSDFILFTVALKFVSGNFYGLSLMYSSVKSSAFSNWNV